MILPIAVGVVGGAININPIYKQTLKILDNPNADELSRILLCVGMANNLAAIRAIALEGVNLGHMKMHRYVIA